MDKYSQKPANVQRVRYEPPNEFYPMHYTAALIRSKREVKAISLLLFNPTAVLPILDKWQFQPQVSENARNFWRLVQEKRDQFQTCNKAELLACLAMSNPDFLEFHKELKWLTAEVIQRGTIPTIEKTLRACWLAGIVMEYAQEISSLFIEELQEIEAI